jgi:drug/metabolite transporter (DMT)-like permease
VSTTDAPEASARTVRAGLLWAMLGVLLFSFSLPLTKVAVGGFNPFFTAMGRAVIAGTLATIVLLVRRVPIPPRQYLRPLFFTMLGAVFGWAILLALALQRTTSAHAAVIAAFMPLTTAAIAVRRAHEHVSGQFWVAAMTGTGALVVFALSRGGASGGDPVADLLVVGAVLASSWCYVEGAVVTRVFPGWQVISWVVVLALPVTVPASIALWMTTSGEYDTTTAQWASLIMLGLSSMYLAFFAWYRGLATAGIAHASQTQQLQPLLTLVWSALLLGEVVTLGTVAAALVVIGSVSWALRSRPPLTVAPEE